MRVFHEHPKLGPDSVEETRRTIVQKIHETDAGEQKSLSDKNKPDPGSLGESLDPMHKSAIWGCGERQPLNDKDKTHPGSLGESLDPVYYSSHIQRIKSKFRSYDELKADFQKINAEVKTDFELLMEIMGSLNVSDISDERLPFLLEDLSYLLHQVRSLLMLLNFDQVDNGRLFSENEGFTLLRRFIAHPNITIQKQVFSTMSAAIQGNSDVKVAALQSGLLDLLCLKLRNCTTSAYPPDESVTLMASALTTLGALLRDFPSAQKYFFSMDPAVQPLQAGFDLLATLYDYKVDGEILRNKMSRIRIQLHLFVSDLVLERTNAKQGASLPSEQNSKRLVKLYSETEFESALARSGWCDRLYHSLLHDMPRGVSADRVSTVSTHGPRQELLSATLHLHPFCDKVQPELYSLFQELEQEYAAYLALPENKDDLFFQDMLNLVVGVRKLFDKSHASRRAADEL
ncbi:nucleotide exchange factor SIL1 [Clonorchis sinensis]|uniref:Nucleotide exchange factor SIL1 n=1 Tax=Clonorchis sinensis TaxID=79923 RepID=G7YUM5_CLOSI|nr:nucleotide exchange factor SIL1 [Clonorchis sinensis]